MATGTDSMRGLYVPLYGNFTIKARVGATDIMTIEGAGSTGDFIVCRSSAAVEAFVVEDSGEVVGAGGATYACLLTASKALTVTTGNATVSAGDAIVTAGDVVITNDYFLRFTSWPTTVPVTGLTLGDIFLLKISDTIVSIGVAVDGSNTVRYIHSTSG